MALNRKIAAGLTAGSLSAIIITGTLAWTSMNSQITNVWFGKGQASEAGGTLHDDHTDSGANKDVYVENWGNENLFVRVRLAEYMELGTGAGILSESKDQSNVPVPNPQNHAVSVAGRQDVVDIPDTWQIHIPDSADPAACTSAADFHHYWNWDMGGSKFYYPAPENSRQIKGYVDSGSPEGLSAVSVNSGGVKAKQTLNATVMTMAQWKAGGSQIGPYWVMDTDGWSYWAAPLEPGSATGLLVNNVTLRTQPDQDYYYGINVIAQMATKDGATEKGEPDNYNSFGEDINGTWTQDGHDLMDLITGTGITATPTPPPASDILASGDCGDQGDNVKWILYADGRLVIYGAGNMGEGGAWRPAYQSDIKSIVIEDGVTSIGNYSFESLANLTSVTIADSVKAIGGFAFAECLRITEIDAPGVINVGTQAFQNCTGLEKVHLGMIIGENDAPGSISTYAVFRGCNALTEVFIGVGIADIGTELNDKPNLQKVMLPYTLVSIPAFAFWKCPSLTELGLPTGITSIGDEAFEGTNLTVMVFPQSLTKIGSNAFRGVSTLQTLIFDSPDAPELLGGAFEGISKNGTVLYLAGGSNYTAEYFNKAASQSLFNGWTFRLNEPEMLPTPAPIPPSDVFVFNGHSYQLYHMGISWHDAENKCEALGGHLVAITSSNENEAIIQWIRTSGMKDWYWLGGTDEVVEGDWRWITGEPWSFTYWDPIQPDNANGEEHYLETTKYYDWRWNDLPDSPYADGHEPLSAGGYICEWEYVR